MLTGSLGLLANHHVSIPALEKLGMLINIYLHSMHDANTVCTYFDYKGMLCIYFQYKSLQIVKGMVLSGPFCLGD
jgi:hypothetical protein